MDAWNKVVEARMLLYNELADVGNWILLHQEKILLAAFALLAAAAVWLASGMWHTANAGKRAMREKEQRQRKELYNKAYEKWLDITLEMFAKGEITDKQQAALDYQVAKTFGTEDLMPKRSQDYVQRRLKSFLTWKQRMLMRDDDNAVTAALKKHAAPVNIPGPKPGEEVKTVPLTEAKSDLTKSRLAKAFTRKKAKAA